MDEPDNIREQFPILKRKINGAGLVYFDNGATTHKPQRVIDKISKFYSHTNSNIHRGVHTLSRLATEEYEASRRIVAGHFNVKDPQQIIFTAGTTDSINIVALGLSKGYLKKGDEIIVSSYEHHSNILPWQLWAQENHGKLRVIPLKKDHSLDYDAMEALVSEKTRLIAIAEVSNTLGLITDLGRIKSLAKKHGIAILVDGAQGAPRMQVDLEKHDVDFYACSAHKIYGPTGTGLLYLSAKWLRDLPNARTGGGTIKTVTFDETVYSEGALRFEAGTPNIAGAIGFGEAIRFVGETGMDKIFHLECALVNYAQEKMNEMPELEIYGKARDKAGVISFNVKNQHPFDVGTILDKHGIAVRTGHHCTQPLMKCLETEGTIRISFAVYNTRQEVDFFIEKLKKTISMLS